MIFAFYKSYDKIKFKSNFQKYINNIEIYKFTNLQIINISNNIGITTLPNLSR